MDRNLIAGTMAFLLVASVCFEVVGQEVRLGAPIVPSVKIERMDSSRDAFVTPASADSLPQDPATDEVSAAAQENSDGNPSPIASREFGKGISSITILPLESSRKMPIDRTEGTPLSETSALAPFAYSNRLDWVVPELTRNTLFFEEPALERSGCFRSDFQQPLSSGTKFFTRAMLYPITNKIFGPYDVYYDDLGWSLQRNSR
jgi:hypothetical protein